ncbi:MBL fold metallo-hydrolase [Panacibacter ginsenosidivorans]|uniref:MBL fold metallo-hydrolase n=1 Tax=Panacibacter ginsenosidivorans TaxID=1813871 RepID=A0A5B8VDJ2_9BACT|nr:MBL fold metallo-hydrolase [Panacibacter ginsenosidivorans]QEC69510.1 MBL fold metallo-hydrolase [Panacibacter ginsenosidivorans]
MSLFIASLNSGSNGNCYYVGNDNEAVLIDAGISCRETEKRMKRLGLMIEKVKAVFVSHEHTDHINGISTISNKHKLPVYITAETLRHCRLSIAKHLIVPFSANKPTMVGNLSVKAFTKFHDADDPHSFVVESNAVKVAVITDIGITCEQVIHHFKQCHAAFLESNYDETMLATGSYPYHLKKRISGGNGHLSNTQALNLFLTHRPSFMSHLILSHLSKNNNKPEIVENLFAPHAGATKIIVASRYEETQVYEVKGSINNAVPKNKNNKHSQQLALF